MTTISKNTNQNNFNKDVNFNGPTQFASRDIVNNTSNNYYQESLKEAPRKAQYIPQPKWRSPFTLAVLTWISFIIAIGGLLPVGIKLVKSFIAIFNGIQNEPTGFNFQIYPIIFVALLILFIVFLSLRKITKNQTRYPLIFNLAISGYGKRLIIEKINIDRCPKCQGKMRYYSKPLEWRELQYSNGKRKREITKKVPALECKRNPEHWYEVDPAEDIPIL